MLIQLPIVEYEPQSTSIATYAKTTKFEVNLDPWIFSSA